MNKIKTKDKVFILSGKDKGKIGVVAKVFFNKSRSKRVVLIDGINIFKKHSRAIPNKNKSGGIVSKEMPIDYSNVALFCDKNNKFSRVFIGASSSGKKSRFFRSNGEVVN